MKEILLLILGGVLVNNYAFEKFLGVTPLLGYTRRENKLVALGLSVTVVLLLVAAIAYPVQAALANSGFAYLRLLVLVALVLAVVYVVELISKALLHRCLGVYFPLIALNSAVLGLALENGAQGYSFGQSLAAALGVGLGFLVALLLMSGVQSRIEEKNIPAAFRGLPISLLAASIIAMVLVAFK